MRVDLKRIDNNFETWAELVDLGYEMALAGIRHQFPGKDPEIEYRKRWKRWQEEHFETGLRYLEVLSRAERTRNQSNSPR